MAVQYGMTVADLTKTLYEQATEEQHKGTKGLTKFLAKWRKQSAAEEVGSDRSRIDSWSLVDETGPSVFSQASSTPGRTSSRPSSTTSTPAGKTLVMLPAPGIYGQTDRKAGTGPGEGRRDETSMTEIAKAIQQQTNELATLVRTQQENTNVQMGTLRSLGKQSEELVFLLRACGQYTVQVGGEEHGAGLAQALLAAQAGASTKLRAAGFKQKVTQRLAIGLAGPFWGTQEKYALSAADFVACSDAELDQYTMEVRTGKQQAEQRPPMPIRYEDWLSRVKRQTDIWALVYGAEWRAVREHAAQVLGEWHLGSPHRWPMQVVCEVWEELHWRFVEELTDELRKIKKISGRESMTLQDLKFYALMPDEEGQPALSLPRTFDLHHPDGWFVTEVLPRIERRQERLLWKMTWEGSAKPRGGGQPAGGGEASGAGGQGQGKEGGADRPTLKGLWGPKLTPEEVSKAKERAPADREGKLLCWGNITHLGCSQTGCQRSHEPLRGTFESLDPSVQMQLLRRGGLKRMKPETKESVWEKIKELRSQVAKDKANKIKDGKDVRRAGQGVQENSDAVAEKAGGLHVTWAPPEEMVDVDYTQQEETFRQLVQGPNPEIFANVSKEGKPHEGRHGESAPDTAKNLVKEAQRLADGPVLRALENASDDLYAWAATRVANDTNLDLESLLEDMVQFGLGELAEEAACILEEHGLSEKAGHTRRCQVGDVTWTGEGPGCAQVDIDGEVWKMYDYREEIYMTEELAGMMGVVDASEEKRQCVTKVLAAGILRARDGALPSMSEVGEEGKSLRLEQARLAVEAEGIMGHAEVKVSPVEREIRMYSHDILKAHHDKDYRALAVFPLEALSSSRVAVIRLDYKGDILLETITGQHWKPGQKDLWCLVWKGHMTLLIPPSPEVGERLIHTEDGFNTPSLGFSYYWHQRHDQPKVAPGLVVCRLCKPMKKVGSEETSALVRKTTCLPALGMYVAGGGGGPRRVHPAKRSTGGSGLVLREFFAGHGVITKAWLQEGAEALTPVELYEDPHRQRGPRPEHDLSKKEVQDKYKQEVRDHESNVHWVACPCTTFCDWQLRNGGTRTFDQPAGQPTLKEENGNNLSNFGAELFEISMLAGNFPIAESSGTSGRYPKQWNLPAWRRLIQRPDVDFIELDMCAFGLGPPDTVNEFYRHKTGLVFPHHPPLRQALLRLCPGVSEQHRHIGLKGARPGSDVTRCTEAGVYTPRFVQAVVLTLLETLQVDGGGLCRSPPQTDGRDGRVAAGVMVPSTTRTSATPALAASTSGTLSTPTSGTLSTSTSGTLSTPTSGTLSTPTPEGLSAWSSPSALEASTLGTSSQPDLAASTSGNLSTPTPGTLSGWFSSSTLTAPTLGTMPLRPSGSSISPMTRGVRTEGELGSQEEEAHLECTKGEKAGGTSEGTEDHDLVEGEEEEEQLAGVWLEPKAEEGKPVETPPVEEGLEAVDEVEVQDGWRVDTQQGVLRVRHPQVRESLFVPGGLGFPFEPDRFRNERYTFCERKVEGKVVESQEVFDNWRETGEARGPFEEWTGFTLLVFQGYGLPWETTQSSTDEDGTTEGDRHDDDGTGGSEDEPEEDEHEDGKVGAESLKRKRSPSTWDSFEAEGIGETTQRAAFNYIEVIDKLEDTNAESWHRVREAGDQLLEAAGGVQQAALALWVARERNGMNNLDGVYDEDLEDLLHPDHLGYLREIRDRGMPARYQGERERVPSRLHPRARNNLDQVYSQIMKDVKKHRVLLVTDRHPKLSSTVSSPFEAVPKMLPNRSLSTEMRLVHDQRRVNQGTDKTLHPPASQPLHEQVVRRILWLKTRYPGVRVLLAKKDVAGAFRLLWVDPRDVELFGGDLPWQPEFMGPIDDKVLEALKGKPGLTVLYLVSSFGFSGSPGEWGVWGRATEELHRGHRPQDGRRDGEVHFCGKILVDDMVLIEPEMGLRPWISSEVYEWGVVKLLGSKAINKAKDAEEGQFESSQTIWGVTIDANEEVMSLPEARVLKGAYLLSEPQFNYGCKTLTLKDLQRFRGIATGWASVVAGLKNELKAADIFLGGLDGGAAVSPKLKGSVAAEEEEHQAWMDLWELFEDCRWLCARSETWSQKFGGDIRELLPPLERLSLPGTVDGGAVFVSSDATPTVIGAIDWTNKLACREEVKDLGPWVKEALKMEACDPEQLEKLVIHLGEMLSFVAFACKVGAHWSGRVVVFGGDNMIVFHWVSSRRSGVRGGRLLIRVLNLVERRYRCRILGGWWRTFHNEDADALTRLDEKEALEKAKQKGWEMVDIKESVHQALVDTERFGTCFLSWADQEDRQELMRLRELRVFRSLYYQPKDLATVQVTEWTMGDRFIKDYEAFGGDGTGGRLIAATIGPDPQGKAVKKYVQFLEVEEFDGAVLEGPREVAWGIIASWAAKNGWNTTQLEFITSELGEAMARRRVVVFLHAKPWAKEKVESLMVKGVTPPSIGSYLGKVVNPVSWVEVEKFEMALGQGNHLMLPMVGAHVWFPGSVDRHMVYKMCGPGRWPLSKGKVYELEEIYVLDKHAPVGFVRRLLPHEIWVAQGRKKEEMQELSQSYSEQQIIKEGCRATGRRTALTLLSVAAELMEDVEGKVGMCIDKEDHKTLGQLIAWLRRWRKGEFRRAEPLRKAGGQEASVVETVWFWGEELWIEAMEELEMEWAKTGGRRVRRTDEKLSTKLQGEKFVNLNPDFNGDLEVQAQVEEWLEEHLQGDKAASTQKAYQAAWQKWCDWSRRQGWLTPYLSYKVETVENENKLLGYLGYLGWLGTSVATMKQAVFAIKDAHKRAGHGDATGKMHRLWIVLNSLEKNSVKRPRRLGVTVSMLKWIGKYLVGGDLAGGELRVDCRMLHAALTTAWFFMLRAREFADSSGVDMEMILRGEDVQLTKKGQPVDEDPDEVTIQFRKTKADQEAFGACRTMLKTEVEYVCVVSALNELRKVAPRRFGKGPEAHLPLFRWASGVVLRRLEIQNVLQKAAKAVGLPAERFQSHSLRIGGASALYQSTGEVELVKRTGRWTSSAVHRYLHDSGDVLKGLAGKMAKVDQFVHYT